MAFRLIHEALDLFAGAVALVATTLDRAGFLGPFSHATVCPIPVTLVAVPLIGSPRTRAAR
jgi:hypothetical protein